LGGFHETNSGNASYFFLASPMRIRGPDEEFLLLAAMAIVMLIALIWILSSFGPMD